MDEGLANFDEGLDVEDGHDFDESAEEEKESSDKLPILDAHRGDDDEEEEEEEDREEGEIRSGDSEEEERLLGGEEDESKLEENAGQTRARSLKINEQIVRQDSNESTAEMPVLSPVELLSLAKENDDAIGDEVTTDDDDVDAMVIDTEKNDDSIPTEIDAEKDYGKNIDDDDEDDDEMEIETKAVHSPTVERLSSATDEAVDDVAEVERLASMKRPRETTTTMTKTTSEKELTCDIASPTREASVVLRKVVVDVKPASQDQQQQQLPKEEEAAESKTRKSWLTRKRSRDSAEIAASSSSSSSQPAGRGGGGDGDGGSATSVVVVVTTGDEAEELAEQGAGASPMAKSGQEISLKRQKTEGKEK